MKKSILKVIALSSVIMLMLLSFAGCFSMAENNEFKEDLSSINEALKDVNDENYASNLEQAQDLLNSNVDKIENIDDSLKFKTVEDWLNDSATKAQMNSQLSQLQTADYTVEIKADGNELIYEYKYKMAVDEAATKKLLEQGMSSVESYFKNMIKPIQALVTTPGVKVTIKYLNNNGNVILAKTFN